MGSKKIEFFSALKFRSKILGPNLTQKPSEKSLALLQMKICQQGQ